MHGIPLLKLEIGQKSIEWYKTGLYSHVLIKVRLVVKTKNPS
jgi:hypothetical protein